jgi:hypothetical protein
LISDVENLGNSTLVSFMVINLVLLLGYFMDGREAIQATILEVSILPIGHSIFSLYLRFI